MAGITVSKMILEWNFLFWKVFPTKISKKGNFDGLHKWLKNHFGIEFPFLEILMAYISRSCDPPKARSLPGSYA